MKHSVLCALLIGMIGSQALSGTVHLSFDTLFPETAAKQLHDTMLQLWFDLTLLHDDSAHGQSKQDVADLVTGQLVRIGYLIEHMQTKSNTLNHEDVAYLQSIATGLYERFDSFLNHEHIKPLWQTIINGYAALQDD